MGAFCLFPANALPIPCRPDAEFIPVLSMAYDGI
jgi:hypothetical protein